MVAVAVLLTSFLVTVPVYAASKPMVVKSYMLAKGEKFTLNVYDEPDNAKISYKSKKSSVASVNKKGVVTAKKPGKTDIVVTIKVGKKTYQAKTKVTVKKSMTVAEYVATTYAELALMYTSACDLAIANGWEKFYVNEAGLDQSGTSMVSIYDEPVLAIDAENGVLLLRIQDTGYRGVLAVGKDPAALSIEMCSTLGSYGQLIGTTAEEHDGVLAMNASGFLDPGGNGNGGQLAGYAMSNGEAHGTHFGAWAYKRIELHEDNLFYIKDANSTVGEGCTDATEFQPAMIIDGVKYTTDYWTDTQPRACIGQSDKYEILMLVIEGRYPLDGIVGTSVNTCSDILLKHGCMQAMNLDGGSSAMMWFDGKYVMQSSSSPLRYSGGRPTPNAWVYKRASAITEE